MAPFSLPYHVYLDLDVINNDYDSNTGVPLKFEETRNAALLDGDSSEYFVSIVRFSLQTANSLPVFIPQIDHNSNDINKTIYKITFVYTKPGATYTSTRNLMYKPSIPYSGGSLPYNYYYIYNYLDIMKMINSCFNNLMMSGDIVTNATAFTPNFFAPFIEINPDNLRCSICADKQFFVNRYNGVDFVDSPQISIFFNTALKSILPSLPYQFNSETGDLNFKLIFEDLYNTTSLQVCTNTLETLQSNSVANINKPGIQITEEISSISIWNPISSIVFTSGLPIVATQTCKPKMYSSKSTNYRNTGEPVVSSILSDFEVSVSVGNDYRDIIHYTPEAEYRMIDMYPTYNLNKIDLSVYWKNKHTGELTPFYLMGGCSASVKLMFRRKRFFNIN